MFFRARKLSWGLSANCQRGEKEEEEEEEEEAFVSAFLLLRPPRVWLEKEGGRETIFQTFFSPFPFFSGYTGKMTPAERKRGSFLLFLLFLVRLDGWIPIVFAAGA